MGLLRGCANKTGTEWYKKTYMRSRDHFRKKEGLYFSAVGLGTYLGDSDHSINELYCRAVKKAVSEGCNVLDTALIYRGMLSERAIGKAIRVLYRKWNNIREATIISTKAGFIPVDIEKAPCDTIAYLLNKKLITNRDLKLGHSMEPEFIKECVGMSLQNLGLEAVDICYIHNPEKQFDVISRENFYKKLTRAFQSFEDLVLDGKIRMYGTATWSGYRADYNDRDYLSLEKVLRAAENTSARKNHRFRAIQLPISFSMPEAFLKKNQKYKGKWYTLLELAERLDLIVYSSRTIDAGMPYARQSQSDTPLTKRIQVIRSLGGVTTALVGMKNPKHLIKNLEVFDLKKMTFQQIKKILTYV